MLIGSNQATNMASLLGPSAGPMMNSAHPSHTSHSSHSVHPSHPSHPSQPPLTSQPARPTLAQLQASSRLALAAANMQAEKRASLSRAPSDLKVPTKGFFFDELTPFDLDGLVRAPIQQHRANMLVSWPPSLSATAEAKRHSKKHRQLIPIFPTNAITADKHDILPSSSIDAVVLENSRDLPGFDHFWGGRRSCPLWSLPRKTMKPRSISNKYGGVQFILADPEIQLFTPSSALKARTKASKAGVATPQQLEMLPEATTQDIEEFMLAEEQCVLSGEQALQVHTRHLEPSLTTGKAKKRARRPAGERMEDSDESDSDPSPVKIPQVTPRPTENVYEVPYRTKKPRRRHAELIECEKLPKKPFEEPTGDYAREINTNTHNMLEELSDDGEDDSGTLMGSDGNRASFREIVQTLTKKRGSRSRAKSLDEHEVPIKESSMEPVTIDTSSRSSVMASLKAVGITVDVFGEHSGDQLTTEQVKPSDEQIIESSVRDMDLVRPETDLQARFLLEVSETSERDGDISNLENPNEKKKRRITTVQTSENSANDTREATTDDDVDEDVSLDERSDGHVSTPSECSTNQDPKLKREIPEDSSDEHSSGDGHESSGDSTGNRNRVSPTNFYAKTRNRTCGKAAVDDDDLVASVSGEEPESRGAQRNRISRGEPERCRFSRRQRHLEATSLTQEHGLKSGDISRKRGLKTLLTEATKIRRLKAKSRRLQVSTRELEKLQMKP